VLFASVLVSSYLGAPSRFTLPNYASLKQLLYLEFNVSSVNRTKTTRWHAYRRQLNQSKIDVRQLNSGEYCTVAAATAQVCHRWNGTTSTLFGTVVHKHNTFMLSLEILAEERVVAQILRYLQGDILVPNTV